MAAIHVMVGGLGILEGELRAGGIAHVEPDSPSISWRVTVNWTWEPADINEAMLNAAIAAANEAGYLVGPNDDKRLYGAATK